MLHNADDIENMPICLIDNQWYYKRPIDYKYEPFLWKLKDAWGVLIGKYDAIKFYKQ